MGPPCIQRCHRAQSALAMSNSLLVLVSILALSSHDDQQDAKSIVGISVNGVASAFDIRRSPSSKSTPNPTFNHRRALFFADDEENDSSSSNDGGSSFFFMNDESGASGNPTTSSVGTQNGIKGFTPHPPSIPPPPRLFRMHNATPSPPKTSTGTGSTLFERKAVVLSSTISGNDDPNMSISSGGYSPSSTANNVDAVVGTISNAFNQAKRAGSKFLDVLDVDIGLPNLGGSIRAIVDDNADVVQPFLQMVGNAATKAAEIVAPAIEQIEEEEEVIDVPKDTVDGVIFAALAATQVTTHSPVLTAMAGCLAVYAVKSPGLGGDVARLVGSATISIGYFVAVVAQSTANSAISSLPNPIGDGVVRLSKAVGGAVNAARDEMKESDFIQKVVSEAIPTAQSQLYLALEAIGKAFADSANSNKQYLLAPVSGVENHEANVVAEVESLPESTDLLTAASAISPDAILQIVREEEEARAIMERRPTIVEKTDRRWEIASQKKEASVETKANTFQRDLLERQLSQPHLASTSEVERTKRLLNMRRHMLDLSVAEQKRSLDRLEAPLATSVDNPMPFQQSLLSRQLSDSKAKSSEASVFSIEAQRSDRLKAMRRQMLEISVVERNRSLDRLEHRIKMDEKRHQFAKIEAFAQQAVDAATKASHDAQRAMNSGMTMLDIEAANTNELLSNLQLIRHKPSDGSVEEAPEDAADDSVSNDEATARESKRARAKKALKRLMPL